MVNRYSATQFGTFFTCPEAWRRRYVEGDKIPPGIAAVAGSGFHAAPEEDFKSVIAGNGHLTVTDCQDAAATEYVRRLSEDGIYLTRDDATKKNALLAEGKDNAVRAAGKFREDVAEKFEPTLVEHEFTIDIEGISKPVLGYIDVFTADRMLADWKLSKAWNQEKTESAHQATVYNEAIRQIQGTPPAKIAFQVFKPLKKEVKHAEFVTSRDATDLKALVHGAQIMERMIKAGDFPGAPPGHWKCMIGGKWCGYWATCPHISDRLKRLPNV